MDLRARVQKYIEERDLLRPGESLVLGVSGGPDSLCLLDLLHVLAASWKLTIHVAHLNHGLRPEAAADAGFVRVEAEKRGLPFHTETAATRAHALAHKQSIEEAARGLRYAFLARLAHAVGAQVIAVAHTADDQAETVLMHFLRGSGVAGLRGMLPKVEIRDWRLEVPISNLQSLRLIRPLLTTTRAEVEAYCVEHNLHPVQDASNRDMTYFRNRLRHELLPRLEAYNPNIRAVLQRTAEVIAGDHEILRRATEQLWRDTARLSDRRVVFEKDRWLTLSPPEQRALLREAVRRLRADLRNVDFTPLEHAIRFSRTAQVGRSCDLLGGLCLTMSPSRLVVSAWDEAALPVLSDVPLLTDQDLLLPGWRFQVTLLGEWTLDAAAANASGWRAFVDVAALPGSYRASAERLREVGQGQGLRLRSRRPGDCFHPLGLGGHRVKVSDFMINAKIAQPLRGRWPLVVCADEIVWVAGLRLDERFKVTARTQRVMRLEFVKDERRGGNE